VSMAIKIDPPPAISFDPPLSNGMIRPSLQSCTMTAFKTARNVSQDAEVEERTT
jgi:hypothetical protein